MMLELKSFEINNQNVFDSISISDKVFGCAFKPSLIHQVVSSYLTNSRQGSKSQKSRSEVAGSNKKPWRQKGTGRARAGSLKSPIWRSGGVTFASQSKSYNQKINKKMYRGAMRSILSKLYVDNRIFLIKDLYLEQPKTKFLLSKLKKIVCQGSVLIITDVIDKNLFLASRNLYMIKICDFLHIDPVSLINFDFTLFTEQVLKKVEVQYI